METSLTRAVANPHIDRLKPVFSHSRQPIEWFVIAHNDARMMQTISSALDGKPVAFLELPQQEWDFNEEHLREAIDWVLHKKHVKNLIVVGHSRGGESSDRLPLVTRKADFKTQNGYEKMLSGIRNNSALQQASRQEFGDLVRQLCGSRMVRTRRSEGGLSFFAFYFLAETGVYLAYEPSEDVFHPLVYFYQC